jgi:hypothetical protein
MARVWATVFIQTTEKGRTYSKVSTAVVRKLGNAVREAFEEFQIPCNVTAQHNGEDTSDKDVSIRIELDADGSPVDDRRRRNCVDIAVQQAIKNANIGVTLCMDLEIVTLPKRRAVISVQA